MRKHKIYPDSLPDEFAEVFMPFSMNNLNRKKKMVSFEIQKNGQTWTQLLLMMDPKGYDFSISIHSLCTRYVNKLDSNFYMVFCLLIKPKIGSGYSKKIGCIGMISFTPHWGLMKGVVIGISKPSLYVNIQRLIHQIGVSIQIRGYNQCSRGSTSYACWRDCSGWNFQLMIWQCDSRAVISISYGLRTKMKVMVSRRMHFVMNYTLTNYTWGMIQYLKNTWIKGYICCIWESWICLTLWWMSTSTMQRKICTTQNLYIYINVLHLTPFVYIKCVCCLLLTVVILIYIYSKQQYFLRNVYLYTRKEINAFYVRNIYI